MSESSSQSRHLDLSALLVSAVEFVLLIGLWMMFVSLLQWNELIAGVAAALIGAFADAVIKATDFASFEPELKQLLLIFRLPGEVLRNTLVVFGELFRRLAGAPPRSRLLIVPFDGGGVDRRSAARRALAILYSTIPPNSVVVGIDQDRNYLLLHNLVPEPVSPVTRKLGARV